MQLPPPTEYSSIPDDHAQIVTVLSLLTESCIGQFLLPYISTDHLSDKDRESS